jgi:hypothetical protein
VKEVNGELRNRYIKQNSIKETCGKTDISKDENAPVSYYQDSP